MASVGEATETVRCELLEWDSEHFGFPIARVAGSTLTPQRAAAIDQWCLDQGIRCLYLFSDAQDTETARAAAAHEFRVVDVRAIVRRSLEDVARLPLAWPDTMVVRQAIEEDLEYLGELAARSHHGSRFYFDGGFPRERCDAFYRAWVERGFRDPDRMLRVPILDGEPAGYQVVAPLGPDREGHGELLAIDEEQRGRGVAQALHVSLYRVLAARGAVTQLGRISIRSLGNWRLHERLGFLIDEVETCHHKWYE